MGRKLFTRSCYALLEMRGYLGMLEPALFALNEQQEAHHDVDTQVKVTSF